MWWSKKKQLPTPEDIEATQKGALRGLQLISELAELLDKEKEVPMRLLEESKAVWRYAMTFLMLKTHIKPNQKNYVSLATYTTTILCLGYLLCRSEKGKEA